MAIAGKLCCGGLQLRELRQSPADEMDDFEAVIAADRGLGPCGSADDLAVKLYGDPVGLQFQGRYDRVECRRISNGFKRA